LVEKLKAWLGTRLIAVSEKSTIATAIRYGLSRWDGLVRFLDDGRIEMDTNSALAVPETPRRSLRGACRATGSSVWLSADKPLRVNLQPGEWQWRTPITIRNPAARPKSGAR
jgi:hypothetical protein